MNSYQMVLHRPVETASDMGQPGNPLHTDGLTAFYAGLRGQGFTQAEIDRMAKENPARLIGLQ